MRVCRWCGDRVSAWRVWTAYCRRCRPAVVWDHPSPPCPYMSRIPEAGA